MFWAFLNRREIKQLNFKNTGTCTGLRNNQ